ncbi:MAG: 16S rRNA (guanine(527)-N(7))-methyltransferase RsmG [Bacteroidetes bacterium]|nr:16S rRNA (guanine(527)-N(7))-methyltransferase RsmG [Bacteroidota bacterium]MBU1720121.1 16S rRNA (guanine(527)-N(7))-methyltransferase RsmG [Bacteroidota bacterium]
MELIRKNFPGLDKVKSEQFEQLFPLYSDWNSKINVISRKDIGNLYLHHVLHSLAIARFMQFAPGSVVMDLGSGGGFPGIPLAIMFPETQFHLVDSIGKKTLVITEVAKALDLQNVRSAWARAEACRGPYDFIVCRAVSSIDEIMKWTAGKISKKQRNKIPNGLILLKGSEAVAEIPKNNKKFELHAIDKWYDEDWFKTKKLVYVKA